MNRDMISIFVVNCRIPVVSNMGDHCRILSSFLCLNIFIIKFFGEKRINTNHIVREYICNAFFLQQKAGIQKIFLNTSKINKKKDNCILDNWAKIWVDTSQKRISQWPIMLEVLNILSQQCHGNENNVFLPTQTRMTKMKIKQQDKTKEQMIPNVC